MIKSYNVFASTKQETIAALTHFTAVVVGGMQEITSQIYDFSYVTTDLNAKTGQACTTIKSPQELVELQSKWMSQFFSTALASSAKMSEISTKLVNQIAQPLQARICGLVDPVTIASTPALEQASPESGAFTEDTVERVRANG